MKTLIEHTPDHDVYRHQLDPDERHAAAGFIGDYLVPKLVAGWEKAPDYELAYEVRRLAGQRPSELTTLLLALVTTEQARRAGAS